MHKEPGTSGQLYIEPEFYQFENKCLREEVFTYFCQNFTYFRVDFVVSYQPARSSLLLSCFQSACLNTSQSYQGKVPLKD